jgi:DNA processing protein
VLSPDALAARLEALRPWLKAGGRVVVGDELARFDRHPVCCLYGFGDGRVPLPRAHSGRPLVAIVGSRSADLGWCLRAERIAAACARAGVVVVSGGAAGIDRAAQQAARDAGGDVVVVQGTTARPPFDVVSDPGLCWLTPYGPWRAGARHLFAERNAWIAACADVVVVVCGAGRSGTRHTVDAALRFRRPVVTLAARDDDALGVIPRRLVARGAPVVDDTAVDVDALLATPWWGDGLALPGLLDEVDDVVIARRAPIDTDDAPLRVDGRSDDNAAPPIVRLLARSGPLLIDDAAARLCTPVRALLADVALLEVDGVVRREGALLHAVTRP